MGTYNYTLVEKLDPNSGKWGVENTYDLFMDNYENEKTADHPFEYQSYAAASFIAGIRNYYEVTPIAAGRSLPSDHESIEELAGLGGHKIMTSRYGEFLCEGCSYSWVLLSELLDFNYDDTFEDRRDYRGQNDMVAAGEGEIVTYREFLGEQYFKDLSVLKGLGKPNEIRVIWKFD